MNSKKKVGDNSRISREIEHGSKLAQGDTESVWGWGSPAGRLRAARRAALIAAAADLDHRTRVLEVGCGTGLFTEMFAKSGARIVAVDLSPDLLEKARRRDMPPPQVQFIEGRFEDCALEDSFDAIVGSSVLHHLDLLPSCRKLFMLLKPGGILSFAEPNMLNPQVFAERKLRRWFPHVSPDETAFVRWKLKKTLREIGFGRIVIVPFDWLHPATPRAMIPLVQRFGLVMERTPIFREFAGSLLITARRPERGRMNASVR